MKLATLFRRRKPLRLTTSFTAIASGSILAGQAVAQDASGAIIPARIANSLPAKTIRFLGRMFNSRRMRNFGTPRVCGIASNPATVGDSVKIITRDTEFNLPWSPSHIIK